MKKAAWKDTVKRSWGRTATRVDAMSLRERVFLFMTLLLLLLLLGNLLWVAPAQDRLRLVSQRFSAQDGELQALREELKSTSGETGTARLMREELAQIKARLAEVNEEIAQVPQAKPDETPLSKVLVHFLRRHEGLTLVRAATLPPEQRVSQTAADGAQVLVRRQAVELTVAGPYGELTRYVETLERALPALRWGGMKVNSEEAPTQLTLQVWLVGATP